MEILDRNKNKPADNEFEEKIYIDSWRPAQSNLDIDNIILELIDISCHAL